MKVTWEAELFSNPLESATLDLFHHKNLVTWENRAPKDLQVLSLGDVGFLLFFRVVSGDYGKPGISSWACFFCQNPPYVLLMDKLPEKKTVD